MTSNQDPYLIRFIVAFDALVGTVFDGNVGETISARADTARRDKRWWGCWMCRFLDFIQKDHCANALLNDRRRAQAILADLEDRIANQKPS